MLKREEN